MNIEEIKKWLNNQLKDTEITFVEIWTIKNNTEQHIKYVKPKKRLYNNGKPPEKPNLETYK